MNITSEDRKEVCKILRQFLEPTKIKVFIFGSRATNKSRLDSDLDLLIHGKQEIPLSTISLLREAFEESSIPYKVDIVDYFVISKFFKKTISKTTKKRLVF